MSEKIPDNPRLVAARIKDWPRVELVDQKGLPTCSHCHSTDIRHDPENPDVWGCAECGLESDAVFVHFRALTCPEDGTILTNAGNSEGVICPRCEETLREAVA